MSAHGLASSASLEVALTPAEFGPLSRRDLSGAVCVVFDVLRATSSMVAALASGAQAIVPVATIEEALSLRAARPGLLLAGERDGLRIGAELTGGVEFDLGNSPREFTPERVAGRTIVMTTTNGTRALDACAGARAVLASSFLNLGATLAWLAAERPEQLVLVCAGTFEEPALEDIAAAGALCAGLDGPFGAGHVADGAVVARRTWEAFGADPLAVLSVSRNGRRLLSRPELAGDVAVCSRRDAVGFVAPMGADGAIRKAGAVG